ncbi:hypothetical protein TSUD_283190 [Trifolium subterraneum]|uniref:CRM domain-containing protein n=1 Tax=Trifolium subterraneum TaxID=3900 RepID=A0A2Z6P2C8_TRISU|nr:hypothetical protein TSUD_283190 [Trifolium subterraneum]
MDDDNENCNERESHSSEMNSATHAGQSSNIKTVKPALVQGVGTPNKVRFQLPGEAELLEEVDSLLEGLGPRFTDWWGYDPVPVDADLLPAVIPGFRRPFRLLPYGVKSNLTNDELTTLKRLARPLPCHFALGRNRKLQGVSAAIIKLWERCEIVKIAVKRGVQNTSNKIMAEEIKPTPALFGAMWVIHVTAVNYNFQSMLPVKLFRVLNSKDVTVTFDGNEFPSESPNPSPIMEVNKTRINCHVRVQRNQRGRSSFLHELSSIGRDIILHMQGPGFEPRAPHLFTLKGEILATRLLDQKETRGREE